MLILKQSTSVDIRIGPFVDATDGVTAETGVTLGAADQAEVLKANGAATVAMAGTFAAVTGADGWYDYTVAAGDVDTVGEVVFVVQDADVCLPVFVRAQVVEEAIYDGLFASGAARVPADVTAISGDTTAADNAESAFDGTGYGFTSCTMPTTTSVTNAVTSNVTQWNGASVATPSVAGVPEVDITHIGGVANSTTTAQLGVNVESWNGTSLPADIQAGYPTVTVKVGTGTGELDIDTGTVDADVVAINGNATSAANLSASTRSMQILTVNTGNVASTTTTAQFTGATEATADHFIGRKLFFYDSGDALFLQGTSITDSSWDAGNSEIVLTFQQLTEAPSDGDLAVLV